MSNKIMIDNLKSFLSDIVLDQEFFALGAKAYRPMYLALQKHKDFQKVKLWKFSLRMAQNLHRISNF